jgi:hypothetical protein
MTSPIRHNCQHAVHDNQDMPLPPVPEPDFTPQAYGKPDHRALFPSLLLLRTFLVRQVLLLASGHPVRLIDCSKI